MIRSMSDILQTVLQQNTEKSLSFEEFCRRCLPHFFSHQAAKYQKILIQLIDTKNSCHLHKLNKYGQIYFHEGKEIKALIDIEPRNFGKSTRLSFAYPLYALLTGKSKFTVLFAATENQAHKLLDDIRIELEENEEISRLFGPQKGSVWQAGFLKFSNGSAIAAKGSAQAVRGLKNRQYRPDLIICDDLLTDMSVYSQRSRDKVYSWLLRSVLPLGQEAFFILVNTVFHSDDLPSRLLERVKNHQLPGWAAVRFSALLPSGKSLWPQYWPVEKLRKKRGEIGSYAFACEYQNMPQDEEDRVFKASWIKIFTQEPDRDELQIFMGIDPSMGKKDSSAIVTLGRRNDGIIFVLDEWAEPCSPDRLIKKIIEKYLIFQPVKIAFEEVGFQAVYKNHILQESARQGLYLPMVGIKPGRIGKTRILSLSPLIENGLLLFRSKNSPLVTQILDYPHHIHDDLNDALYYAFSLIESYNEHVPIVVKTPARHTLRNILK